MFGCCHIAGPKKPVSGSLQPTGAHVGYSSQRFSVASLLDGAKSRTLREPALPSSLHRALFPRLRSGNDFVASAQSGFSVCSVGSVAVQAESVDLPVIPLAVFWTFQLVKHVRQRPQLARVLAQKPAVVDGHEERTPLVFRAKDRVGQVPRPAAIQG